MLYDIAALKWDEKLLRELDIPASVLPQVKPSCGHFGDYVLNDATIPINGVAGDQQAALFGQACFEPGQAKNTYGTGCFMLMNTGTKIFNSRNGLITTIAWGLQNGLSHVRPSTCIEFMLNLLRFRFGSALSEFLLRGMT